jgi:cytochrome P450 family 142 subfamily A polypeptide 1
VTTPPGDGLHVLDHTRFARPQEDCLSTYRWLRDEAPVHCDEPGDAWILSRYEDVVWASKSTDFFSSAGGTRPNLPSNPSMINRDEPRHGVLRRFISKGFTPNQLAKQADSVRRIATGLIDRIAARGECDFVQEVDAILPLTLIGRFPGRTRQGPAPPRPLVGRDDPRLGLPGRERHPRRSPGALSALSALSAQSTDVRFSPK